MDYNPREVKMHDVKITTKRVDYLPKWKLRILKWMKVSPKNKYLTKGSFLVGDDYLWVSDIIDLSGYKFLITHIVDPQPAVAPLLSRRCYIESLTFLETPPTTIGDYCFVIASSFKEGS